MSTVDDPTSADRRREMEEKVSVQGAIESVGVREVLRLALGQSPSRLTLVAPSGEVVLWCVDDALAAGRPGAAVDAVDAVADALGIAAGTFTIDGETVPAEIGPFVAVHDAIAAAERQRETWDQVVAVVPDARASVRLARRLGGPAQVTAEQWRVLSRVGGGRTVADLAAVLAVTERTSQQIVAGLASIGLLDVVRAVTPLTALPLGPALPPPGEHEAALADDEIATDQDDATVGANAPVEAELPAADPWLHDPDDEPSAPGWVDETTAVVPDPTWDTSEPEDPTPDWAWDAAVAAAPEVTSSWDHEPALGEAAWVPTPTIRAAAATATVAPAEVPYVAVGESFGAVIEPAGPGDELIGTPSGDDELVNRALLFKFLSSVRD